ncbi:sn-glycerol-3-phosphate ABC transporter ATP-binding protein UgpC [Palleronia sp. LCG004]|uniref:ABC transporter ATP-binding protein n=1 Tax=Palleronia sp. LCG004 TaxID=3079304 RepID=UPI002943617C|nr:sn-glycerol-3-phosphate ABC transporter ATP-binding protein UgpC [Palleronia sp. LCG004]WOI55861.1 sn-glycerol-3-phosphate ABC transporter ATP-binding protein UgpC [Palleronia sp. LCG004]
MGDVTLTGVSKTFGETEVIPPLDLSIASGEFVVFVGPSGCGKSTLLRMIAGLEEPSSGRIEIAGRDVTHADPADRGLAMVFQTYALYPHMSVAENMEFGLEMARMPKPERERAVQRAAGILQITDLLDRLPRELSGGQRQRVAIGRAIVRDPALFLFDEPLSNLDAELRVQMRLEIARLHSRLSATMIYVTHDQTEAMTMADRIVVLRKGVVEQVGRPAELYADPDNIFVAGFIGSPRMNFLPATLTGIAPSGAGLVDVARLGISGLEVPMRNGIAAPGTVTLGIRPEDFVAPEDGDAKIMLDAEVVENLGGAAYLYTEASRDEAVVAEVPRRALPSHGDSVPFGICGRDCFLFDTNGGRI